MFYVFSDSVKYAALLLRLTPSPHNDRKEKTRNLSLSDCGAIGAVITIILSVMGKVKPLYQAGGMSTGLTINIDALTTSL